MNGVKVFAVAGSLLIGISLIFLVSSEDDTKRPLTDAATSVEGQSGSSGSSSFSEAALASSNRATQSTSNDAQPVAGSQAPVEAKPTPDIDVDFQEKLELVGSWTEAERSDIAQLNILSDDLQTRDIDMDRRLQELDAQLGINPEEFEENYPGFKPE